MDLKSIKIEKQKTYTGHAASIYTLDKGLHEASFISGAGDGLVAEWFVNQDIPAKGIVQIPAHIFSIKLIKKYNMLAVGQMKGGLHMIDLIAKKEIQNLGMSAAPVYDIYFHEEEDVLYAASGDGNIYRWAMPEFTLLEPVKVSIKSVRNIEKHPFKNEFVFATSDGSIYIYDANSMQCLHKLAQHKGSVFCARYTPDGSHLLTGAMDAQLCVWNMQNYSLHEIIPAHLYTINDVRFSPDGMLFATAGRDKHIKIWRADTLQLLKVIDKEKYAGHAHSVNKLFWNAYNNNLISCSDDKTIISWSIQYI
jgi:WD40 repeat protein